MAKDANHEQYLDGIVERAKGYSPKDKSAEAEDIREFAAAIQKNRAKKAEEEARRRG